MPPQARREAVSSASLGPDGPSAGIYLISSLQARVAARPRASVPAVDEFAICATCGTQFGARDPERCPVCADARQYVPESGQRWTTLAELRREHGNWIRDDAGFTGIGTEPSFAIGQRALLVPWRGSNLLWDCITLLDDETAAEVERRGGLAGIAISHPHYYSAMVEWADRFDCPILLHADDAEWAMRRSPRIEHWHGKTRDLGGGPTLVRCGGHVPGGQVLHVGERRALLFGDVVHVIPDRGWVSFMRSYPNLIPLAERDVRVIAAALEPYGFDTIHSAWWDRVIRSRGAEIVQRSAERYVRALAGTTRDRSGRPAAAGAATRVAPGPSGRTRAEAWGRGSVARATRRAAPRRRGSRRGEEAVGLSNISKHLAPARARGQRVPRREG
jgi:glyoxylase-like metal-dependent hydrolase (beta-lactamase superfamily II)